MYLLEYRGSYGRWVLSPSVGFIPALQGGAFSLYFRNVRDTAVDLGVRFFRPDVAERSEALVYRNNVEIPPEAGSDDPWRAEDVVSDRPYRIEVEDRSGRSPHHYHYQPDCSDDDPYDIGVLVRLNPDGGVAFSQTTCSSDAPFL